MTRSSRASLGVLFAVLYFVQGAGEPATGLLAQPINSLLKSWGDSPEQITAFTALVGLPWSFKPLFGLLTDFLPFRGRRRRPYLILASLISATTLLTVFFVDIPAGAHALFLLLLVLPTFAVAFSDVVTDGLMIDEGRPRGLTGWLQSIQWTAMYAATLLAGVGGGWLSQHGHERLGFLIAGTLSLGTLVAAAVFVREPPTATRGGFRDAVSTLFRAARSEPVLAIGAFLFLWAFNPFSHTVMYLHLTEHVGFSEQFFGTMESVSAGAAIVGSVAYGFYCRRLGPATLLHGSIAMGVLTTIAYWALSGTTSALLVTAVVGFSYMTGGLAQLDLAARVCPPETAATVFALLMALANLGVTSGTWVGGILYERWSVSYGAPRAFELLVGAGASATAACWVLSPWLLGLARSPPTG